jgi:hypothetical protein
MRVRSDQPPAKRAHRRVWSIRRPAQIEVKRARQTRSVSHGAVIVHRAAQPRRSAILTAIRRVMNSPC